MLRELIPILCLLGGLSCCSNAIAASFDIRSSPESQLDVSVVLQHSSMLLTNETSQLDTDISQIGFQLIDIPFHLPIQLGLAAGYAFIDQQAVEGLDNGDLGGGYVSLISRVKLLEVPRWSSELTLSYSYLMAQYGTDTEKTRLRWNHTRAQAKLNYFLTGYLSLAMGVVYGVMDARLSGRGDREITLDLKTQQRTAGILQLDYHLATDQKVAFQVQRGYIDTVKIQFQRTF